MCWSTKDKNYATPILAEKDIKVYKVLVVMGDSILSPCQDFEWELGVLYDEGIKVNTAGVEVLETRIYDGFHSLKFPPIHKDGSWCIGDKELFNCGTYDIVFEAIIPKGSVYYENEDGEIVSTALKLKGIYLEEEIKRIYLEDIKTKFKELCCLEKK